MQPVLQELEGDNKGESALPWVLEFVDTFPAYVRRWRSDLEIAEDSLSLSSTLQQEKGHVNDCSLSCVEI